MTKRKKKKHANKTIKRKTRTSQREKAKKKKSHNQKNPRESRRAEGRNKIKIQSVIEHMNTQRRNQHDGQAQGDGLWIAAQLIMIMSYEDGQKIGEKNHDEEKQE